MSIRLSTKPRIALCDATCQWRDRETEIQRDRETETQTDRETDGQRDRETEKGVERQRNVDTVYTEGDRWTSIDKETERYRDRLPIGCYAGLALELLLHAEGFHDKRSSLFGPAFTTHDQEGLCLLYLLVQSTRRRILHAYDAESSETYCTVQ
jgi:hypothetical protein